MYINVTPLNVKSVLFFHHF